MWTKFEVDGRTLSYLRRGSGPLLVCVPGGPGMDPIAYFSAMDIPGFELLIFAPRGTGASSRPSVPEGGYYVTGYVQDLESLREHLGVERLTLYGNSHGGMTTLAYACAYPERVERAIVTNGPARMDDVFRVEVAKAKERFIAAFPDGASRITQAEAADVALEAGDLDADEERRQFRLLMARYVAVEGPKETEFLDRLCAAPMNWDAAQSMYEELLGGLNLLDNASKVTAPILVIAGEFDVTVPPAAMQTIAKALPTSTYREFPGVGHFVEVEAHEDFSLAVCEFLLS